MNTATATSRRRAALLFSAAIVTALSCADLEHSAATTVSEFAGRGATDCGSVDGHRLYGQSFEQQVTRVRECVNAAIKQRRAFYVHASPASADGGVVNGFAFNGQTWVHVVHDYVLAGMGIGCDQETFTQNECERLDDRGPKCGSAGEDLCFTCVNPAPWSKP